MSGGTNASRGTSSIALRTRSSSMPRPRSWRSTMRRRASVDVVPEGSGVMHDDFPTLRRDESLAFERGEEASGALARGTGQLRDVVLGRLDQHVALAGPLGLARVAQLHEHPGHAPGDG